MKTLVEHNPDILEYLGRVAADGRLHTFHLNNSVVYVELLAPGVVGIPGVEGKWDEIVALVTQAQTELQPDEIHIEGRPGWLKVLKPAGFEVRSTCLVWKRPTERMQ